MVRMQDKHDLAPANARHEKSILVAGFLGRQKLLIHTLTIGNKAQGLRFIKHFVTDACRPFCELFANP